MTPNKMLFNQPSSDIDNSALKGYVSFAVSRTGTVFEAATPQESASKLKSLVAPKPCQAEALPICRLAKEVFPEASIADLEVQHIRT